MYRNISSTHQNLLPKSTNVHLNVHLSATCHKLRANSCWAKIQPASFWRNQPLIQCWLWGQLDLELEFLLLNFEVLFFFSQTKNSRLCLGITQQFRTQQAKTTGGSPPGGYFLFSSQTGHIRTFQSRRQRQGEEEKWILSRVEWVPVGHTLAALGRLVFRDMLPSREAENISPSNSKSRKLMSDPENYPLKDGISYLSFWEGWIMNVAHLEGIFIPKSEKNHEKSTISMDRATTWPIPSNVWYTHIDPIKINHSSR